MPQCDTLETFLIEAENLGNAGQESHFLIVHIAVSGCNVKKPVENIFKEMTVLITFTAKASELTRIAFITCNILLREIIQANDMGMFFWRHGENALERAKLVLRHHAIGFGHFGRKRNHRNGECNAPARIRIAFENRSHSLDNA